MKGAGCLVAVLIVVVAAGLGAIRGLQSIRSALVEPVPHGDGAPAPGEPPSSAPPAPDPDRYAASVDSLNEFRREDVAASYRLSYGFIDHGGVAHRVSCSIAKADYQAEWASFGYVKADLDREVDRRLQAVLEREADRRGLKDYITFEAYGGGGVRWRTRYPSDVDPETIARVESLKSFLYGDLEAIAEQARVDLYRQRGFRLANHQISPDYGGLVVRGQRPLANCYLALRGETRRYSERQALGLYLAFFQEIRYEVPPDEVRGVETGGFWVPTEVLVNAHGDCDSKAAAFCAMMRSAGTPVLLIEVPEHALVGVEARPGPGQAFVRVGNRYFVLCEVAGPAKLAPGNEGSKPRVSGSFEYTLIEPDTADLPHGSSSQGASHVH